MKNVKIKITSPGLIVKDPETRRAIPVEGKVIRWSSYWDRRLQDGDIVICDVVPEEKALPVEKAEPSKKKSKKSEEKNKSFTDTE